MDLKSFMSTLNTDSLVGLSVPLSVPEDDSIMIGYFRPETGAGHVRLPQSELKAAVGLLYTGKDFPVAVHGLKRMREVYQLRDLDLEHERIWDTRLMAHLLDPGRDDDHGYRLSALVRTHLNQDYPYMGENLFAQDYPEFLRRCVEKDAELVHRMTETLVMKMDSDLLQLYREAEFPVSSVLVQMHLDGIAVNQAGCERRLAAARQELEHLESQFRFGSRNLFSARKTYWYLHDAGVDFPDDIGRGFRIDDDELKELAEQHGIELAAQVLLWRKLKRDVRFLEAGAGADRVHPVWRMTRTSTGRIVASDPPVQNIDKKKYRPLLIAPPGRTLVKADWKTCQARILAHLSKDPELIRLFTDGEDLHSRTAQMLGLGSRDEAKPINFGIIFGQSPRALAREITASWNEQGRSGRVDEAQAQRYIDAFFGTYKGILPYFYEEFGRLTDTRVSERVLKNPVTGRLRRFPKQKSDKLQREMKATLLQQVESHLLKVSLVKLNGEIRRRGLDARIVACIHDSIWLEAPLAEEQSVREIMETVMTTAMSLSAPLLVDFED
ncbi:DNA polymerase [Desulfomonile tiedjei]|uniref:DNA polymerase n=1 Tax=Desulfomonile tiedjei TaxID=2358 RepID=UPI00059C6A54|nr:DNA polymerase [Desulfomonile tiedjei]